MGFVRTKSIKGKKYAYLVENVWTDKGPRQRSKKYLGRVHIFSREKDIPFNEFYENYNYHMYSKKELLRDSIKLELINHGFKINNKLIEKDGSFVDIKTLKIFNSRGKEITLGLNQGILCKELIKKILKLKIDSEKEVPEKEGYALAKLLVESGLKVEPEIFIRMYELSKS